LKETLTAVNNKNLSAKRACGHYHFDCVAVTGRCPEYLIALTVVPYKRLSVVRNAGELSYRRKPVNGTCGRVKYARIYKTEAVVAEEM
jgi:hypothetical protein